MIALNNLCAQTVNWTDSLLVLLIGALVVFFVLAVLIVVVKAYVAVLKLLDLGKNKDKKVKQEVQPKVTEEQVAQPTAVSNDDELIAVITAAISAVYAQTTDDGEVPPFRVKSIFLK